MSAYLSKARDLLVQFSEYPMKLVPREQNSNADALAKLASAKDADTLIIVSVEYLAEPSIDEQETMSIDIADTWMTLIIAYLEHRVLPSYRNEAKKMLRRVSRYLVMEGILYRRGYAMPLLRCVIPD